MSFPSTTITVSGTPTVFLPLSSPWPSASGCASNIYLHTPVAAPNTFLAWDPLYGASMVTAAQSCLPPQVTAWWQQTTASGDADIYTALGPDFHCPEAYTAVQTVIVASSLHQTLCCPSKYTMLVSQPTSPHAFPSQCVSTVMSGETLTHITSQGLADAAIVAVPMTTSALVFAVPVNGFSISMSTSPTTAHLTSSDAPAAVATAPSSTAAATAPPSTTAAHHSPSPGVYGGAAAGAAAGLGLLVCIAWLCFRHRRRRMRTHSIQLRSSTTKQIPPQELPESDASFVELNLGKEHSLQQTHAVYELPAQQR